MSLTILTADQKDVSGDWQSFLGDKSIGSTIIPEVGDDTATDFSATPTRFFGLKFTTGANASRFKLLTPFVDSSTTGAVLLGLEQKASWSGSLKDVLTAFIGNAKLGGTGVVAQMLTALAGDAADKVKLTLVNPADKPDTRNAMWCIPGQTRVVSTALIFTLDPNTALESVKQAIKNELGLNIGNLPPLTFYMQQTSYGTPRLDKNNSTAWSVTSAYSLGIGVTVDGFDFWFQQESQNTSVTLTQNKDDQSDVWTKLQRLSSDKNAAPPSSAGSPSGPDILGGHIDLLSVSLGRNPAKQFWWDIKTVFEWDTSGDGKSPILIGLSYASLDNSFVGELLTRQSFQFDKKLPTYRASADVAPRSFKVENLPEVLYLSDIFPEAASLPSAVPNAISVARVAYSSTEGQSTLAISAKLVRSDRPGTSDVPAPFTWDSIAAHAQKSTTAPAQPDGKKTSNFAFGAAATFTLHPREADKARYLPANLGLSVEYNAGQWTVAGGLENLQFGVLVGFMDGDEGVRNAAIDILGKLSIKTLDILYTYKDSEPSSFCISGTIQLGDLELRLFYQYVGAKADAGKSAADMRRKDGDPQTLVAPAEGEGATWQLRAYLGAANGKKATLGEIIDSIAGKDNGTDVIPEFVKSIEIAPAESDADSAISLEVSKTDQGAVFAMNVDVLGIKFSYTQISAKSQTTVTRLLRLEVDKLPLIGSIPLISQLGQPFTKMMYLYVSGDKGLLQREVEIINTALGPSEKLMFKRVTAKPSSTVPVIEKGHHFMVVNDSEVILDHVFEIADDETKPAKAPEDKKKLIIAAAAVASFDSGTSEDVVPSNTPSKGALSKTLGPLNVSAVTLQYKDKVLWIHLDAVLTLGPISLSLIGFGIGFLTTGIQLTHLSKIAEDIFDGENRLRWELQGISISFSRPPVMIAGMFEHTVTLAQDGSKLDSYKGGVGIASPPYMFVGVGEYSAVTLADRSSYKSVFIFAKLDGPLVTLEFATISGVRLGFGFNSVVRSPRIDELTNFPFIKTTVTPGASDTPMAILKAMTPMWVTPKENSYWLAAGMTVSSFDIIAITAVAMFAFRDSGVVLSIFADAVAQLPPDKPSKDALILYVELGIVAEMNLVDGYFRAEASIAPSSFLLVPQCHLTGGFALAYWFGDNPHAGDWVFSVGGYHPMFKPPPYYPVPQRLGISFVIGNNIQMLGQSYFAITPKAAMAGALIHVSLSVGPVSAYLDASFDALINFHPFHYIVEFSVSVGVECSIDIWFIHIHISAHIGADLQIRGPKFGGIAHVNFWFFGFDIGFGAPLGQPPTLELLEFWNTTHKPGPSTSDRQDNDPNPVQTLLTYDPEVLPKSQAVAQPAVAGAAFKFVLQDGNFPTMPTRPESSAGAASPDTAPNTGAGALWHVKGGSFQFGITTEFALSHAIVAGTDESLPTEAVFASPMHITQAITSSLTIEIRRRLSGGTLSDPIPGWRGLSFNHKAAPAALWSPYDPSLDIMARGPRAGPPPSLLDGTKDATRMQAFGISLSAPLPVLSLSQIPKFNASAAAKLAVEDLSSGKATDWYIPDLEGTQTRFLAAPLSDTEKKMDAPARWKETAGIWDKAVSQGEDVLNDAADGVLAVVATKIFGWDVSRPVGEVVADGSSPPPWLLRGKPPKKLMNGLEDFYLVLPRVCV